MYFIYTYMFRYVYTCMCVWNHSRKQIIIRKQGGSKGMNFFLYPHYFFKKGKKKIKEEEIKLI